MIADAALVMKDLHHDLQAYIEFWTLWNFSKIPR